MKGYFLVPLCSMHPKLDQSRTWWPIFNVRKVILFGLNWIYFQSLGSLTTVTVHLCTMLVYYRTEYSKVIVRCFHVEQSKCCLRLEERLAQDWRRAFSEQLVDSVQDVYDFFQSDARLFFSSALFRLLKHIELRMSFQLRTLFTVSEIVGHCVPLKSDAMRCDADLAIGIKRHTSNFLAFCLVSFLLQWCKLFTLVGGCLFKCNSC